MESWSSKLLLYLLSSVDLTIRFPSYNLFPGETKSIIIEKDGIPDVWSLGIFLLKSWVINAENDLCSGRE